MIFILGQKNNIFVSVLADEKKNIVTRATGQFIFTLSMCITITLIKLYSN